MKRNLYISVILAALMAVGILLFSRTAHAASPTATIPTFPPTWTPSRTSTATTPTPTDTPTIFLTNTPKATISGAPFIIDDTALVLFPSAIHFSVALKIPPGKVRSATLHIYQTGDSKFDVLIPASEQKNLQEQFNQHSTIYYNYLLKPDQAPSLFQPLYYEWKITSTDNTTGTISRMFTFQDMRANDFTYWETLRSSQSIKGIQFYSQDAFLSLIQLQNDLGRVYAKLQDTLALDKSYRFVLYNAGTQFCQKGPVTNGTPDSTPIAQYYVQGLIGGRIPCDPEAAKRIYDNQGYTLIIRPDEGFESLKNEIATLMFNDAYDKLLGGGNQPPLWFREGLRQYYSTTPHGSQLALARQVSSSNQLLSLAELTQPTPKNPTLARLWNAQSYLLVLYLSSKENIVSKQRNLSPVNIVFNIANTGPGQSFENSLKALYDTSSDTLYTEWKTWLSSADADNLIRYTVYSPATPTPSPTYTATYTFTPRPTSTPQPTETATSAQ